LKVYATTSVYFDPDKIKKASPRVYPCATVYLDSPVPFGYGVAAFYMTNSSFEKLTGLKGYSNIYINIEKGANRNRIATALKKLADSKSTGRFEDAVESLGIVRKFFSQISLLILGLSFLILIIGVISMYITIKSNILLQMNELGILRAVGMSRKGLRRLFLYEGLAYGIFSSGISLIASILFCCVVFSTPEISASPFVSAFRKIPWIIFISTFGGNIVLCISITLISIRSVFDLSIVEAIKSN
jgi:ABC-type antimicrobial peptide transport system permease subunit